MHTIRITTSQNIDIDYEVAGLGERILAYLIDWGIFLLVYYLFIVIGLIVGVSYNFESSNTGLTAGIIILIVLYLVLYVFYDLVCEVFFNGQSIGKRLMKIRVISLEGTSPTVGQYLLRWLFRIIDISITAALGAIISIAVSDKKQRIGDIVAGTTVIKTNPRTTFDQITFSVPDEDYVPVFEEVKRLSENDIALITEVINSFRMSGNNMLIYNLAMKMKEMMGVDIPEGMNEMDFLMTILKDYNSYE